MWGFFKHWGWKVGSLLACALLGCWVIEQASIEISRVEFGENIPAVSWLPESASNVSFYKSYLYTAYEFDITETEFRKWSRWTLSQIDQPVNVSRYCLFTAPNSTDKHATIADGFYHQRRQSNGGGVTVAYDRQKQRVFFQSAPR